jgi:serine/threonine protein kinase
MTKAVAPSRPKTAISRDKVMLAAARALPRIKGYRLRRRLGEGRMCTAYLANDLLRGGDVVLKVLNREHAGDEARKASFAQEFAIPFLIRNRHVIRVFDQVIGEEHSYIVMDYLGGGDLTGSIRQGLRPRHALSLLRQAAVAVGELHRHGFVHCDVKPANLFLHSCGDLVLADFGLARRAGTPGAGTHGTVLGTPCYASPEQAEGGAARPAADIYSLGVVFYEMLRGSPPFGGASAMEVQCQHMVADVPKLPAELAGFQPLIDSMLRKHPRRRLPDGEAVLHEIDLVKGVVSLRADATASGIPA